MLVCNVQVRVKEKLMERRSTLIEDLIKTDPTYRPPADYRPAKKHRKVRLPESFLLSQL